MTLMQDDVSNGNISALLALCAGNSPVTGEFPTQGPVTRSFDVCFDKHKQLHGSKMIKIRDVIWLHWVTMY